MDKRHGTQIAILIALVMGSPACDSSQNGLCVPGQSSACACTNGQMGAQLCMENHIFGACVCTGSGTVDMSTDMSTANQDLATPKLRVFITSSFFAGGDLRTTGIGSTGVDGADKLCNAAAQTAGLGGTWKAWISDSVTNAIDRIVGNGPWYLIDRTQVVFSSRAQLMGTPSIPIDTTEAGTKLTGRIWTATSIGGQKRGNNCKNWTSSSNADQADYGDSSMGLSQWTYSFSQSCNLASRLYCFEQ